MVVLVLPYHTSSSFTELLARFHLRAKERLIISTRLHFPPHNPPTRNDNIHNYIHSRQISSPNPIINSQWPAAKEEKENLAERSEQMPLDQRSSRAIRARRVFRLVLHIAQSFLWLYIPDACTWNPFRAFDDGNCYLVNNPTNVASPRESTKQWKLEESDVVYVAD